MRIRLFLRYFETPLRLRASISRLKARHRHPYLTLLRLFIPFPTWYFPIPQTISIKELWNKPGLLRERRDNIHNLQSIPIWCARDTSLRSLYRLYECMASGNYIPMGVETEYFWYQDSWALHLIEDPKDPDPLRYAILACLAEELVNAFNWRLGLGMRRNHKHIYRERDDDPYPPFEPETYAPWTRNVPPIDPQWTIDLPSELVDASGRLVLEEGGLNEIFAKRNIVTNVGWLYTI